MSNNSIYNIHKVKKLQEQQILLRSELLTILAERERLETEATNKVLFDYGLHFDKIEDVLKNKNTIANVYEKHLTRFIAKLKRGEHINSELLDALEAEIELSIKTTNEQKENQEIEFFEDNYEILLNTLDANKEFSSMFREIVKAIHPDVAGQNTNFSLHWNSIINAYKSKDYEKIKLYYDLVDNKKVYLNYENKLSEIEKLEEDIKNLIRRIAYEKRYQNRLINSEPLSFADDLSNPQWLEQREKLIRHKIEAVDNLIEWYRKMLSYLKSGDIDAIESKEEKKFQNDFFDATYTKR